MTWHGWCNIKQASSKTDKHSLYLYLPPSLHLLLLPFLDIENNLYLSLVFEQQHLPDLYVVYLSSSVSVK